MREAEIKEIKNKLQMIFTEEEMNRIRIVEDEESNIILRVDLHEMKYKKAKVYINNIIAIYQGKFEVFVIHGYNHGTALRRLVRSDLQNPRVTSIKTYKKNQGVTLLNVA